MTTAELVKTLAERLSVSQRQARALLDDYTGALSRQLEHGNTVILRNFGTFNVKEIADKQTYLPAQKTVCLIPAHRKLHFKTAKKLRDEINEAEPDA